MNVKEVRERRIERWMWRRGGECLDLRDRWECLEGQL
jgi:hypothetical protein